VEFGFFTAQQRESESKSRARLYGKTEEGYTPFTAGIYG
jgi:hypothetical protein